MHYSIIIIYNRHLQTHLAALNQKQPRHLKSQNQFNLSLWLWTCFLIKKLFQQICWCRTSATLVTNNAESPGNYKSTQSSPVNGQTRTLYIQVKFSATDYSHSKSYDKFLRYLTLLKSQNIWNQNRNVYLYSVPNFCILQPCLKYRYQCNVKSLFYTLI